MTKDSAWALTTRYLFGEPDVDHWTENAQEFKRIAYGEQENM